ncbi:hypothetical protein SNE40_015626 [Patella caerulea]|uniref:Uncharacterized protein n=1 Tax=Patella caerulea TaxID=87958 RepID=A0AAN8JMK4_PATCE
MTSVFSAASLVESKPLKLRKRAKRSDYSGDGSYSSDGGDYDGGMDGGSSSEDWGGMGGTSSAYRGGYRGGYGGYSSERRNFGYIAPGGYRGYYPSYLGAGVAGGLYGGGVYNPTSYLNPGLTGYGYPSAAAGFPSTGFGYRSTGFGYPGNGYPSTGYGSTGLGYGAGLGYGSTGLGYSPNLYSSYGSYNPYGQTYPLYSSTGLGTFPNTVG